LGLSKGKQENQDDWLRLHQKKVIKLYANNILEHVFHYFHYIIF